MAELDTEYIDLVLIHAPRPWKIMRDNPEQKKYFEEKTLMSGKHWKKRIKVV